ncbi:MAG: thioesterase family protein [Ideonella sp.]
MNDQTNSTPALIPLARLLARRTIETVGHGAQVSFDVTEDWLQGRTAFGGLTSALGAQAMRDLPAPMPAGASLRALQTSFVGPVGAGPLCVEAVLLRDGKSVRQVQATMRQGGQVCAVMLGVFANDRQSTMRRVRPQRPPATQAPGAIAVHEYRDGATPRFLRHFDLRWDDGPMPGSGGSGMLTRIHMRMRAVEGLSDELVMVMMADVSPTPATGQFQQPAPASSVSWALELRPLSRSEDTAGWWRADNESVMVDGGYVNHTARLWAPSGELAALAYQVVSVYG